MVLNSFTVKSGKKSITRHNQMDNVFRFYQEGRIMTSYIYVKYDTSNYMFLTPTLVLHNFDSSQGRLYATFNATLSAEVLEGKLIECVGFSADKSQALIVNYCDTQLIKQQGEPLLISGTLCLDIKGDEFMLFKGENRLVRMLLGCEAFAVSGFRAAYSSENIPLSAYSYEGGTTLPVTVTFTENDIHFVVSFGQKVTDFTLLLDASPVLRVMPKLLINEEIVSATALDNGFLQFAANDTALDITSLEVNFEKVTSFSIRRMTRALSFIKKAELKLPSNAKIKSDLFDNYFAYSHNGRGAILKLNKDELSIQKWLYCNDILPLEDGAYLVVLDNKIRIIRGEREFDFDITAGEKYAAVQSQNGYLFMTYRNQWLYLYIFTPDINEDLVMSLSKAVSVLSSDEVHIFALPNVVCSVEKGKEARVLALTTRDSLRENWLNAIASLAWFEGNKEIYFNAGRLLIYDAYLDTTQYYAEMSTGLVTFLKKGRLYADLNIKNTPLLCEISLENQDIGLLYSVDERVTKAIIKDKFLYLFLQSGGVLVFYVKSDALRIYSPLIFKGNTVSYGFKSVLPYNKASHLRLNSGKEEGYEL